LTSYPIIDSRVALGVPDHRPYKSLSRRLVLVGSNHSTSFNDLNIEFHSLFTAVLQAIII